MYRVVEVAEELKVSKVTIYNKLKEYSKELKPHLNKLKGITYINYEGLEIIRKSLDLNEEVKKVKIDSSEEYNDFNDKVDNEENLKEFKELTRMHLNDLKDQICMLQKELDIKNEQLERKDKLLENFQVLLKKEKEKTLLLEEKKPSIWEKIFKKR